MRTNVYLCDLCEFYASLLQKVMAGTLNFM